MPLGLLGLVLFACTDLAERRIPKRLNLLLLFLLILEFDRALHGMTIWILYLSIFRFTRAGIGYGDVRLAPVTALLTSDLAQLFELHLQAWVIGGLFAMFSSKMKGSNLPFAPFLGLSAVLSQAS